ncbi:MAG TPA: DUF3995 domain-containing protein [Reyranella sp.]|nr:DUF3995 domain-containing protein [Reyranella sp.]
MTIAVVLSLVLLVIAALHAYWGLGGLWPAKTAAELASTVVGDGRKRMPAPIACFAVAAVLVGIAGWPWVIIAWPGNELVSVGSVMIAAVFFVRGSAGYSPRWRARFKAEPFATRDMYFYSPLCYALAAGFAALMSREM